MLDFIPRPIAWDRFKAEILPAFSANVVSVNHRKKVLRVVGEIEAIDLSGPGEPPRRIGSTADLSLDLVARYIAARPAGESPYTLRDRLMVVQHLCNLAVQFRWLAVSPFAVRPIRRLVRVGEPRDKRALSRDELRRLFDVLKGDVERKRGWALWRARRLYAAAAIVAYTGIRRNELLLLHVSDVDLDARVIQLVPRAPKGMGLKTPGSAKPVGMPSALVPIVRDWLAHRLDAPRGVDIDIFCPWMVPNCRRSGPWLSGRRELTPLGRLQAAGSRAGVPDVTWQALRRSLATLMEFTGAGEAMIQRQLRHSDPSVTRKHYRRADERNIADVMRDVSFE